MTKKTTILLSKLTRWGKNSKARYYYINIIRMLIPTCFYRMQLKRKLSSIEKRKDIDYIYQRLNYYNKFSETVLPENVESLSQLHWKQKSGTVYFFDSKEYVRWFSPKLKWSYQFGDVTQLFDYPTIVKSRPIGNHNQNSVLLNMDKVRHFSFVKDPVSFEKKQNKLIFRGKMAGKENRLAFMKMYWGNPICDAGDVSSRSKEHPEWLVPKMTIREHIDFKFILSLEGVDVASNLKWVMSSNSIAVMPKPKYETWYMEGTLIPDFHYIEIKDDFSDLEEKLKYYIEHRDEALKIIKNAHDYVSQFQDKKREKLISLLVLQKYFEKTGQFKY